MTFKTWLGSPDYIMNLWRWSSNWNEFPVHLGLFDGSGVVFEYFDCKCQVTSLWNLNDTGGITLIHYYLKFHSFSNNQVYISILESKSNKNIYSNCCTICSKHQIFNLYSYVFYLFIFFFSNIFAVICFNDDMYLIILTFNLVIHCYKVHIL